MVAAYCDLETSDHFSIRLRASVLDPYLWAVLEQDTWYEQETPFLRKLARPGLRALNIDHGCGFYSLMLAKLCGPTGKIYNVLSESPSRNFIYDSVALNGFSTIQIINADNNGELIPGYKFDRLNSYRASEFRNLDLVRIGHPTSENIIRHSAHFLEEQSPLLMLEIGQLEEMETWIYFLRSLGYQLLRYIPGLEALKPASYSEIDSYVSHVFFCKPDRLNDLLLRELAFIPQNVTEAPCPPQIFLQDFKRQAAGTPLAAAPQPDSNEQDEYYKACSAFVIARDFPVSLADRFASLEKAYRYLASFKHDRSRISHQFSLFAVELAMGQRATALATLENIQFADDTALGAIPPFLLDKAIADTFTCATLSDWLKSYLLATSELARRRPIPSENTFDDQTTLTMIRSLQNLQVEPSLVIEKRRILTAARLGLPFKPFAPALLQKQWLNVQLWQDFLAGTSPIQYHPNTHSKSVGLALVNRNKDPYSFAIAVCEINGLIFNTYMDIGCADGATSIILYVQGILRNMRIVNVDPNEIYRDNLTQIASTTGGLYLPCAVSDHEGEADFQESGHEYWASLRSADDDYWKDYKHIEIKSRKVPIHTIATLVEDNQLEGPILLKLDVQGLEEAAIRGMASVADKIGMVIVETFAVDLTKIHNALVSLGFSVFDLTSNQYYQKGILGWFYPYYINNRYLPLFANEREDDAVSELLIELQTKKRSNDQIVLDQQLSILAVEKTLSNI